MVGHVGTTMEQLSSSRSKTSSYNNNFSAAAFSDMPEFSGVCSSVRFSVSLSDCLWSW